MGFAMNLNGSSSGNKKSGKYGAASMYLAVPGIVLGAPLIGFLAGRWADTKLDTDPYLLLVGLFLGLGGAVREIYNLVKKAEAMDEEEKKDGV